ncbi:MAG: COQ9 family protein [Magnetovibrionaceae bacterium]
MTEPQPLDAAATREVERDRILEATLTHVPFDGWTMAALKAGVSDAGFSPDMAERAFPEGMADLVDHFGDWTDRMMVAELSEIGMEDLKIRERIKTAVMTRLAILTPHHEAVRKALAYLALPGNQALAARMTYRTVNIMWYEAGDRSTDYNFYTKRGLLAAVLGSTMLCWLADGSDDFEDTKAFLDRRIDNVMQIPKATGNVKKIAKRLPNPFRLARKISAARSGLAARFG